MRARGIALASLIMLGGAGSAPAVAEPARIQRTTVSVGAQHVPVIMVSADLADPRTVVSLHFAQGEFIPNRRYESFQSITRTAKAAAIANGTFFSVHSFDTLGNVVIGGQLVQFRDWDTRGSALTIGYDGHAKVDTLRLDGLPNYHKAWFSFASGPRLLRNGEIWLRAKFEGFQDPHLFGRHPRTAVGITRDGRRLVMACFPKAVTLAEEARAMKNLGLSDAINLDGGPSVGMAYRGKIVAQPKTGITNALVVYDALHPAPEHLRWAKVAP